MQAPERNPLDPEAPNLTPELAVDLQNRFTYHPPGPNQPGIYTAIRAEALVLATLVGRLCPNCRERSAAFTHIEEAVFWANAAIARSPQPPRRQANVVINGRENTLYGSDVSALTYDRIVSLAVSGRPKDLLHTITWRNQSGASGIVAPGQFVVAEEGMIIDAMVTDNA